MKHMKKSMFITTLAMVVVLVVALSTATFAWYSAQSTASVTNTAITSAASSNAAIAVDTKSISQTNAGTSVTITLDRNPDPMIPVADISATEQAALFPTFKTAPVDAQNKFTTGPANATAAKIATAKGYQDGSALEQDFFYIGNTNADNTAVVNVTVNIGSTGYREVAVTEAAFATQKASLYTTTDKITFTSAAEASWDENEKYYQADNAIAGFLRVAVYYGSSNADPNYIGTWATTAAATAYGTIVSGDTATIAGSSSINSFNAIASGTASAKTITLVGNTSTQIRVIAWFDGTLLTADHSKASCTFTVNFGVAD